jgi:hypothetical protein
MYTQVDTYRGRVLHIEGRLLRLRKWDKIPKDAQEKGVKEVYEGWIALPLRGSHPVCVLFPILPEGLEPAEQVDRDVSFDGYLICLYRYRSGKGDLDTPLLIGPSVRLTSAPAEVPTVSVVSPSLLYGFAGFVALVALLVGGLSWWFRRGDRRVREHLDKLREAKALEMLEGDPEPPANGDKAV